MPDAIDVFFSGLCDGCNRSGVMVQAWMLPDSVAARMTPVLEALGYRPRRNVCEECSRCTVCGQLVRPGGGAPRTGPFPPLHNECLRKPEAEEIRVSLRRVLAGLSKDPPS